MKKQVSVLRVVRVAGKAQANEQRYTKLKEKYTELVQSHADLLRKVSVFIYLSFLFQYSLITPYTFLPF